jgi:hypothetical protein
MRYFSLKLLREIPNQPDASDSPELRQEIVVDKSEVLDLTVETGDKAKLGFCTTIGLFKNEKPSARK